MMDDTLQPKEDLCANVANVVESVVVTCGAHCCCRADPIAHCPLIFQIISGSGLDAWVQTRGGSFGTRGFGLKF